MKDIVKTVSILHTVLIGVSAAILAFAMSPDKVDLYKSALHELSVLRTLRWEGFSHFVATHVSGDPLLVPKAHQKLGELGYTTIAKDFYAPIRVSINLPTKDTPIEEFLKLFSEDMEILVANIDISSIAIDELPSTYPPGFRGPPNCLPNHIALKANDTPFRPDMLEIVPSPPQDGNEQVYLSFAGSPADMNCMMSIPAHVNTNVAPQKKHLTSAWLAGNNTSLDHLIDATKQLEGEIGPLSLEQAFTLLEQKINDPKKDLSFLGLKIAPETAIWVGPVSTLTLALYFLAHLQNLIEIKRGGGKMEEISWIGLFLKPLSVSITYSSIVLLPALANLGLVLRSGVRDGLAIDISITITICILMCGAWSGVNLLQLHQLLRKDRKVPPWQTV
jgi:hypothetical protein